VSAPAVLALAPAAALAWATPWVDLPLAVDIASAPAIGLGYVFAAMAGFPARVAAGLWTEDGRPGERPARGARAPFVPWGFVVEHREPAVDPRPTRPLPAEIGAYYAVVDADVARLRDEIVAARRAAGSARLAVSVPLRAGPASALELYPASDGGDAGRRALVLMTPPSKAAFAARYLARWFARRGVHGAVVAPAGPFLEPELLPAEIEVRFRQAAVNARTALRALSALEDVDAQRLGYVGISAGAVFGAALLAVEPSIHRAALILPGGDLPRILAESDESTVRAYRDAWKQRGVTPDALIAGLAREVRSDPIRLAPFIDPARVLLFVGASDRRVPTETGLGLWRALGAPELYLLSGNHETASLCFGFILRRSERFLREGWGKGGRRRGASGVLQDALDLVQQLFGADGLVVEALHAQVIGGLGIDDVGQAGDDHHRDVGRLGLAPQAEEELDAVQLARRHH
jgi:dienelactone hydrolase